MDLEALNARIEAYCRENQQSGVLRVTRRDEVLFRGEYGWADWDKKTPFTDASMFTLYSLSKPFCAMGLLKLYDRGLVDLDAHPGRYVPEAAGFAKPVTLRQMLQHVSGLPDFSQNKAFAATHEPAPPEHLREQVKELTAEPFWFEPGTGDRYENVNFLLAALIVENVSGMSYADYMRREVFDPLGMRTAVVDTEGLEIPGRVSGHVLNDDGRPVPTPKSLAWMMGAGDLVGTVDDVYRLNVAIKRRLLLKPETWEAALTPNPLNRRGFGCLVKPWHDRVRIQHNGGHVGFRTLHVQLPDDDFDLIWLSNCGYGRSREDLMEMVYQAFFGAEAADEAVEMDKGYI